ncbi:unnamed protein product [Cuscuta epithymum]|uniref:G-patch domain-containing protein n=1 Tax=Cuscuta epithymum TaxID=186058 RepID=A0AAV0FXR3_9ASTE|nr:unnamed protein product [Cuscuta epithymum]CAH9140018.1 unnamed protein product [Cuscuta epithymum]
MGSGGCEDVGAPTAMALGCYDGVPATTPNMENNCSNSSVYDHHYNSMSSSMATSSSIPIDSSNIGFRLLKKHGWKEGTGLGIAGQGRLEPVEAHVNKNKLGLGAEKGKKASAPENSKKYRKEDKNLRKKAEIFPVFYFHALVHCCKLS